MKSNILKLGFLLVGTAGLILLAPRKTKQMRECSLVRNALDRQKAKLEPGKINFC
jgi:hypothetical protein